MTSSTARPLAALVACVLLSSPALAEAPALHSVEVPRPFGHVVGDLVPMRVTVELPSGWNIDEDGLPPLNREDRVIELRRRSIEPATDACAACVRIVLDWQVFKSVRATEDLMIPAFPLRLRSGARVETLTVPQQPVSISPLTAWERRQNWIETMQPGYGPFRYDVQVPARRAAGWALAGVLATLLWLRLNALWPFSRSNRPFSKALRALRDTRGASEDERVAGGLRRLHDAFHAVAGEAVFADDLPRFFERFPELDFAREDVTRMFAASRARFFGETGSPIQSRELVVLTRRLARAEARMRLRRP